MAAGMFSPPGSEYGPCAEECSHTDCAWTKQRQAKPCVVCNEPIGYERLMYHVEEDGAPAWSALAHASCWEVKLGV